MKKLSPFFYALTLFCCSSNSFGDIPSGPYVFFRLQAEALARQLTSITLLKDYSKKNYDDFTITTNDLINPKTLPSNSKQPPQ